MLPRARTAFRAVDQDVVDMWLDSTEVNKEVADAVFNGDSLTGLTGVVEELKKKVWGKLGTGFWG